MKRLRTYLILIVALITVSCLEETKYLENELIQGNTVTFAANCSRVITRSGLTYTEFPENTKYTLFGIESGKSGWDEALMYDRKGHEDEKHLIEYGEEVFFNGKKVDFYGATLCRTGETDDSYPVSNGNGSPAIEFSTAIYGEELPDLMYSRNLKDCTAQDGILEMNFIHALSKVQIEISRQEGVGEYRLKRLDIVGTYVSGDLDIVAGEWAVRDEDAEARNFYSGELTVPETTPVSVDGEMLIIPNESSNKEVSLNIVLADEYDTEKTFNCSLNEINITEDNEGNEVASASPFIFEQNYRYVLSIILLENEVRVIAVKPQAYEWIDTPLEPYMGQPVNFGGLMWMDRNLGAESADCEKDWRKTRGFYYQFGRNIPYIFDDEKFINRPASDISFTDYSGGTKTLANADGYKRGDRAANLDIGYEYFFTYNEKSEKVYGAVQGGVLKGQDRFFIDGKWDGNVWKGTKIFTWLNKNQTYYRSNDGTPLTQDWNFYNASPVEYDYGNKKWVEKYSATWPYNNVTSSNIAINPGDEGIYHFIIDARYYTDFYQSGTWCVRDHGSDCACSTDPTTTGFNQYRKLDERKTGTDKSWDITANNYLAWLKDGCNYTTVEDTEKINNLWAVKNADGSFTPNPDNHPCPKGWRIPTGEDFAGILPDPRESFYAKWGAETEVRDLIALTDAIGKKTSNKEDILYGKEYRSEGSTEVCHTIYIIKRKGQEDCYRLRIKWFQSSLDRSDYYRLSTDKYAADYGEKMRYVEISRYPGTPEMSFSDYETVTFKEGYKKLTESGYWKFHNDFNDWDNPTESMQIPLAGFIYTGAGLDCLYFDGAMTILRCTDWNNNYDLRQRIIEAGITDFNNVWNKCNEAQNWCAYLRTDNAQCGVFDGSRKSLGCQIRCVRDVNAQ